MWMALGRLQAGHHRQVICSIIAPLLRRQSMLPAIGSTHRYRCIAGGIASLLLILLLQGGFYASTLLSAPALTIYEDGLEFATDPNANEWKMSSGGDVTSAVSGGMWTVTRGRLQESGWDNEASSRSFKIHLACRGYRPLSSSLVVAVFILSRGHCQTM